MGEGCLREVGEGVVGGIPKGVGAGRNRKTFCNIAPTIFCNRKST